MPTKTEKKIDFDDHADVLVKPTNDDKFLISLQTPAAIIWSDLHIDNNVAIFQEGMLVLRREQMNQFVHEMFDAELIVYGAEEFEPEILP